MRYTGQAVAIDLSVLNVEQRAAAEKGDGPLLIFAGAGSGKTRTLTYRIAHLVRDRGVAPWQILAVTFTNKAAAEMRERLHGLLGQDALEAQVSTFHATGAAILRREAEALGRTRQFVIYDDGDQLALIKRILRSLHLDERKTTPRAVATHIDAAKNEAIGPEKFAATLEANQTGDAATPGADARTPAAEARTPAAEARTPAAEARTPAAEARIVAAQVYPLYERMLEKANAFDFGDLIVKPLELFRSRADVLERYRRRFRYVLVDEFQDTNPAQFELLQRLCPPGANLCVVGDDDQAIYRWRGADVSNILDFERHYPGCQTVTLNRNYRSDANILDAAYAVISNNLRRKPKRLVTDREPGLPLRLMVTRDERGEAQQVAIGVRQLIASGVSPREIAIFYRTNAQSRLIEEALRQSRVAYTIVRGRSFYDRAEVKDAVAYLRAAVNPRSDADLLRVINTPARGLGETTVSHLTRFAQGRQLSVFEALGLVDFIGELKPQARQRLLAFRATVAELGEKAQGAASEAMQAVLDRSGMIEALQAEETPEADARIENLQELVSAAREFDVGRAEPPASPDALHESGPLELPKAPLDAFLEQISLVGESDADGAGSERVSMMTLHAAKGLEFDCVFLTGMEDGVFPHARALKEDAHPEELAEERRLCYVGITRARKRLFFTLAQSRTVFGEFRSQRPSRFLAEIPQSLFAFDAAPRATPAPAPRPTGEHIVYDDDYVPAARLGAGPGVAVRTGPSAKDLSDRVIHEAFGEGRVQSRDGSGPNAKVTVFFDSVGVKKVVARFLRPA